MITTPSTLQLEAAFRRIPVAILDYHNNPQLAPMAWTISALQQIPGVMLQLSSPPPAKMLIQQTLLRDHLQLRSPATPRMRQLIQVMVDCGVQARTSQSHLSFPARIIADPEWGFAPVDASANLSNLFPNNPVFQNHSVKLLQAELAQAIHEMGNYPEKYFDQRTSNRRLRGYINWLRTIIRNRAAKIEDLSMNCESASNRSTGSPVDND